MIAHLTGTITHKQEQLITLALGPIGLAIQVPSSDSFALQSHVTLYTHIHWNQEQGPSLFGFASELDRQLFLLIISCQGIGPRIALAVLADLGSARFLEAVHMGEDRTLSKVSGIGPKKAEHIIVQLKHKVAQLISSGALPTTDSESLMDWTLVTQALESLNYSRNEINRAMTHLKKNNAAHSSFDQLMRQALSFLAQQS